MTATATAAARPGQAAGGVPWRALAMIMLAALCLRAARCLVSDWVTKDTVLYVEMARDWAAGDPEQAFGRNPRIPPLYLWLMAQGERLGLGAEAVGLLVSVLAGGGLTLAVFFLARQVVADDRTAILAAALAAAHPLLLRNSAEVMRESLYLAMFATALALAATGMTATRRHAGWCFGGAGLAAALATLTRDEGGELILVLALWGALECWRGEGTFPARIRRAALAVTVTAAVYLAVLAAVAQGMSGATTNRHSLPDRMRNYTRRTVRLIWNSDSGAVPPAGEGGSP